MGNKKINAKVTAAKSAKVGDIVVCPYCGKEFVKKTYQQTFCCAECKNTYWNNKKDRHRKGYYKQYNKEHPERLERGFTKGYIDGCVSNGKKPKRTLGKIGLANILGYDEFGLPITDNPFGDMLREKECIWHDDDWCESSFDD